MLSIRVFFLILILLPIASFAVIKKEDFKFIETGATVQMKGKTGAPLHIEYVGARLKGALKVRITSDDSDLRISPPVCTFTRKDSWCRVSVHTRNGSVQALGEHQFNVTELHNRVSAPLIGATHMSLGLAPVEANTMPDAVGWATHEDRVVDGEPITYPVIAYNATNLQRRYQVVDFINFHNSEQIISSSGAKVDSKYFSLPPKTLCYVDVGVLNPTAYPKESVFILSRWRFPVASQKRTRLWSDTPEDNEFISNGPYGTGNNNISTCSGEGMHQCTSGMWGSMTVGYANLQGIDLLNGRDGLEIDETKAIEDNSWNEASWSNYGSLLYWTKDWSGLKVALILIQAGLGGSGFSGDPSPDIEQVKAASRCSSFIVP